MVAPAVFDKARDNAERDQQTEIEDQVKRDHFLGAVTK